jgi:EAL and modified HD-GYP domain-containing signal transduction protein
MDIFVARQPIFDRKRNVVAYELLFRSGTDNFFDFHDGDMAASRVIDESLLGFGLDKLTAGRRAFVNFTRRVLVKQLYTLLPSRYVVIELLETVEPDQEVIQACIDLKDQGYTLALDDFVFHPKFRPLIELADIIKVDFLLSDKAERQKLPGLLRGSGVELLAEKVETHEDLTEALDFGYKYFQGFFFCKPEIVQKKGIPGFKLNYLRFIQEVNRPDMDFDRLELIIKQEMSLSVKLLRYLNSAWFGWRHEVDSIRHAVRLLGERQIKKWASLVAMTGMGDDKPTELVVTSLIRARFCELLAPHVGLKHRDLELFLMGMLSLIDALMDRPLEDALAGISISADVKAALLGEDSPLSPVYQIVQAYERVDWDRLFSLASSLEIDGGTIAEMYADSVEWADEAFRAPLVVTA